MVGVNYTLEQGDYGRPYSWGSEYPDRPNKQMKTILTCWKYLRLSPQTPKLKNSETFQKNNENFDFFSRKIIKRSKVIFFLTIPCKNVKVLTLHYRFKTPPATPPPASPWTTGVNPCTYMTTTKFTFSILIHDLPGCGYTQTCLFFQGKYCQNWNFLLKRIFCLKI